MIKEAGIFIISAGFLIYFISPVQEEQKPPPVKIETKQKTVSATSNEDDYWGGEEYGEEEDQEFVFGEPMMSTEPFSQTDTRNLDEDYASTDEHVSTSPSPASRAVKNRPVHRSSPKSGELGSATNPIPLN
ncbi:hypothetical protein AB1K62_05370 [Parasphingorhabdus sp. JC815]|uniref:hypothetical protein n=1 Tax=Parasphingorhabdus sp. JC815 TaxID=3232140 RepID=UPI00345A984A